MKVVQVCEWIDGVIDNCAYVPYSPGLLPDLSINDALILYSGFLGLLASAWVWKQLRNAK